MEMTWDECQRQYDKLCWKMVNKYKNIKLEPDERYNLALFGLWKAYQSYDENRGANFLTHATNVIYQVFNLEYRDSKARNVSMTLISTIIILTIQATTLRKQLKIKMCLVTLTENTFITIYVSLKR